MSLTACSGDEAEADTGLLAALSHVAATDASTTYVEYGDVAAIGKLAEHDRRRFAQLAGYGYSELAMSADRIAEKLGVDPRGFSSAIWVGQPPETAGLLIGDYDTGKVSDGFEKIGAEQEDKGEAIRWRSAADRATDLSGPFTDLGLLTQFNVVSVEEGKFGYSSAGGSLDWVTDPGETTLADDEQIRTLATCLGDPVVAIIATQDERKVAVGVRAPSATELTEVVCSLTGDPQADRDRMTTELAEGRAPSSGQPWAEILPGAEVDIPDGSSGVVRVVSTPGDTAPPGRIAQVLANGDLKGLTG
ncbi:hypothetical protein BAY61_17230 [Prauserella marina]|nr:hypothetical protein BAY61_17230 [Prauserella marina]